MKRAFTGVSRKLTSVEETFIEVMLQTVADPSDEFITGAAYGVDTAVFFISQQVFPNARQTVCVPVEQVYNYDVPAHARFRGYKIISVPGGYMARNDALIVRAEVLHAFPETEHEQLRSGTWATVRRARRRGIPVKIHPLNGTKG